MTSSNTSYTVQLDGTDVAEGTRSKKARAIELADQVASDNPEGTVTVVTGSGAEVYRRDAAKVGSHFRPWTRTETHDDIEVEVPEGYVVSYTRKRVGAVVARSEAKDGLLVITEAGETFEAKNTKEARMITNDLAAKRAETVAALREQEAKDRAEAKAKRDEERAAAKQAKDDEKARKAAEKLEAKAEKERLAAEKLEAAEAEATEDEAAEDSEGEVVTA